MEEKNQIIMSEVEKLDAKAKDRDKITKNSKLHRYKQEEIDQIYYNSIKAKLKYLDMNLKTQSPENVSQDQNQ